LNSRPVAAPATVRAATTSQAATSSANRAMQATLSTSSWLRAARAMVPVTQVPTGKVKLHHVRAKGSPRRTVRTVMAAASASHIIANPQVGTPYSRAKTAAPAA
jgi:hypothetical protein